MVADGDLAADSLRLTDGPELVEGSSAIDGRLVHALGLVDVVSAAIRADGAFLGCPATWVVGAEGLDDVILDQRIDCPSVQCQIRVDVGAAPSSVIHDCLARARVPSFATNPVVHVAPRDLVGAVDEVVVGDRASLAVRPVGIEVTAVEAVTLWVTS